jgi:hypothetical protein
MVTFLPSVNPLSFRPRRNSASGRADCVSLKELRTPITGIPACCARAARGHAAAARSVMKSRRLTIASAPRSDILAHLNGCCCASQQNRAADVRFVPKADIGTCPRHVRFTPKSGRRCYSITSFACARSAGGIAMLSALAVFRLITISYLVGACTLYRQVGRFLALEDSIDIARRTSALIDHIRT